MAKRISVFLVLGLFVFSTGVPAFAADAKSGLKPNERLYDIGYERVWDAAVAVITEKGFAIHPHGKMKAKWRKKKNKGKIKTPVWRYFKIWSAANPHIEKQYQDSYKIAVKVIEVEAPQPKVEEKTAEPAAEAAPETPVAVPAVDGAPGDPAAAAVVAPPEPVVAMIQKVKVKISRKFKIHNDKTRKWVKADPAVEKVGYSIESLFAAIDVKLADETPSVDKTKQVNLNIAPPFTIE